MSLSKSSSLRSHAPEPVLTDAALSESMERNDTPIEPPSILGRYWKLGTSIAVTGVLAVGAYLTFDPGAVTVKEADITVASVRMATFSPTFRAPGIIVAARSTAVAAGEGGTVSELVRQNGDAVRPGDLILRLNNPALIRDVSAARLALTSQSSELVALESQIGRQVHDARRDLREARYRLERAQGDLARQEQLAASGFASLAALERARAESQFAEGEVSSAVAALRDAEAEATVRTSRVSEARRTLARLDAMQAERLRSLDVLADTAGTLTGLEASLGTPVQAAQVVGRIEDEGTTEILVTVPEGRQSSIRLGTRGRLEIDGLPVEVELRSIEPTVVNGEVKVRARFTSEPPERLRTGRSVFVQLDLGDAREALVVPASAAIGGDTLFVLSGDGRAESRRARFGERSGALVEVIAGAQPGQRVISSSVRPLEGVGHVRIQ